MSNNLERTFNIAKQGYEWAAKVKLNPERPWTLLRDESRVQYPRSLADQQVFRSGATAYLRDAFEDTPAGRFVAKVRELLTADDASKVVAAFRNLRKEEQSVEDQKPAAAIPLEAAVEPRDLRVLIAHKNPRSSTSQSWDTAYAILKQFNVTHK